MRSLALVLARETSPTQPLAPLSLSASVMWHLSFTPALSVIGHTEEVVSAAVRRVPSPVGRPIYFRHHLQGVLRGIYGAYGLMKMFCGTETGTGTGMGTEVSGLQCSTGHEHLHQTILCGRRRGSSLCISDALYVGSCRFRLRGMMSINLASHGKLRV